MIRKREEQRPCLPSELMKASVVRNKFEQLKLEKKRQSLDKLKAYESLSFMNRKRELIDLQMSIQSSRTDDTRQGINSPQSTSEHDPNSTNEETLSKNRFRSRSKSLNGSSFVPSWFKTNAKERKMSRHQSLSNSLDSYYLRRNSCARYPLYEKTKTAGIEEANVSCSAVQEEESVWKLLPPVQLLPLHKQKSKSLKEISKANLELEQKLPEARKVSWNGLSDCRYLRGWKNDYSS